MKPKIKFGTEGWRGIIADDFTVASVRVVTRAIGRHLQHTQPPGQGVLVGYDCRAQSEVFAEACAQVLLAMGFPVSVAPEPTSSPALVAALTHLKMQGAIIFSASHNPAAFHGIKFKPHYGGSALTSVTDDIERELATLMPDWDQWAAKPETGEDWLTIDAADIYLNAITRNIDIDAIKRAGFNVVYDTMHGAGAGYLGRLIPNVVPIRAERNPYFGGVNPEPIPQNLGRLFDAVREQGADVGIAVDGDADRIGAADEFGRYMDSHRLFAIALKHLVERRGWRGSVVKTVSSTRMIDKLAEKYGLEVRVTPIGFKYICEKMLNEEVLVGGEESGGIGIPRHMKERDGVFMGLLLLEAMAMSGKKPSELVQEIFDEVGEHHYHRVDLHFEREEMPAVARVLRDVKPEKVGGDRVARIDTLDGTKLEFENGWLLLRASGTEPVVRVYSEAPDPETPHRWVKAGRELIESAVRL